MCSNYHCLSKEFQPSGKVLGPVDGIHWSQVRALGEAFWRYPDLGSAFGSIRVQVFGHASLWVCGFGHRSGLVVPGWVQSIGWAGSPRISRCCPIGCPDTAGACVCGHSPSCHTKKNTLSLSYTPDFSSIGGK